MFFFCLQVDGPIEGAGQGALKSTNDDMHFSSRSDVPR